MLSLELRLKCRQTFLKRTRIKPSPRIAPSPPPGQSSSLYAATASAAIPGMQTETGTGVLVCFPVLSGTG
jgi:hypothetical protein